MQAAAEGDNRVLFQKVAKDLLDKITKGQNFLPSQSTETSVST
jgi:hypothetical protein